ncbi:MAG: hypothetical protein Kow00121_14250 [Elainellaceae cyanobacterium]
MLLWLFYLTFNCVSLPMIQVTFIAGTYRPSQCGVADYTAHLRRELAHHHVQSTVLTTTAAAQAIADPSVYGVVPDWKPASLLPLVRAILQQKTDILHIQHAAGTYQFQRSLFLLPPMLRMLGYRLPIVTTAHEYGWWEWQPSWIPASWLEAIKTGGQQRHWWDREDGFLLTGSQAIITTNDNIAKIISERLPGLQSRLSSIPIAANIDVAPIERSIARAQLRDRCQWAEETQVIVFFGFLHPVKGIETLLKAFRQVISEHLQARLLLIGGVETLALPGAEAKSYWEQLQQEITALELNDFVHRTGYVSAEEASYLLSGSDIGVLPFNPGVTLKSGSLLALLAHQLPSIITRSDETDISLIQKGIVELIPPRDSNRLANELVLLLNDPEQRHYLSQAGYNFVQQFSWSAIAKRHLEIYSEL